MRKFTYRTPAGLTRVFTDQLIKEHPEMGLYKGYELFELIPRKIETKTVTVTEIV